MKERKGGGGLRKEEKKKKAAAVFGLAFSQGVQAPFAWPGLRRMASGEERVTAVVVILAGDVLTAPL